MARALSRPFEHGDWGNEKKIEKRIFLFVKRNKKTTRIREEAAERKERSDIEFF